MATWEQMTSRKTTQPKFSCIVVQTNRLNQSYNTDLRYHNTIRYVYFKLQPSIYDSYRTEERLTIRILSRDGQQEIDRVQISFQLNRLVPRQIHGESINEYMVEGKQGSFMLRFPELDPSQVTLVYVYTRT